MLLFLHSKRILSRQRCHSRQAYHSRSCKARLYSILVPYSKIRVSLLLTEANSELFCPRNRRRRDFHRDSAQRRSPNACACEVLLVLHSLPTRSRFEPFYHKILRKQFDSCCLLQLIIPNPRDRVKVIVQDFHLICSKYKYFYHTIRTVSIRCY